MPSPRPETATRRSGITTPGTLRRRAIQALACFATFLAAPGPAPVQAQTVRLLVQRSPLAGFQYYAGSVRWEEMREGDPLVLVREVDNPHDPNAVRVEWRGEKLGYLPRAENRAVAEELDRNGRVEGRIAALRRHRDPWRRVLIEVYAVL